MSDHEDVSFDTGYSTPVPELDDHTHQLPSVQKPRSRRGTADTMYSTMARNFENPDLGAVNDKLQGTTQDTTRNFTSPELGPVNHKPQAVTQALVKNAANQNIGAFNNSFPPNAQARDIEEAVVDEESEGLSARPGRFLPDNRSRRGTVTTLDPRSASPPNSVKAFADARRRERQLSTSDPTAVKAFAEARRLEECNLYRTTSGASGRSRRTRRFTNDNDSKSFASSHKSAEEDVCFPMHNTSNKDKLHIDFEGLEDFIADEEIRDKTPPPNQPQARIFQDLRRQNTDIPTIVTSDGGLVQSSSLGSSTMDEKEKNLDSAYIHDFGPNQPHADVNRFEYFSSLAESTIHAAEFGDLILPGEDIRSLFTFPEGEELDGVWWLNMNNPTDEEIRAICKAFGVHPLTIEDIGTQEAREKIELFPSYYFACFRSFNVENDEDGEGFEPFNIYVVVFREGTLSFSFSPNPHAANVRKRITTLKDYVALSSDWICYALIDHIVDSFKPVIDKIEMETDVIEDQVFIARQGDTQNFLRKMGTIRKNIMSLMKLLGGKADVLRGFTKRCNADYKVTPRMDIGLYLGDIQDHVVTMMTSLAHFEKMLSRSHTNYLAQLQIDNINQGNNANKILSKVTLLASILVPLNLICGMFGMNVDVPFKNVGNLGPFFGILGFLVLWTLGSILIAKRMRYF